MRQDERKTSRGEYDGPLPDQGSEVERIYSDKFLEELSDIQEILREIKRKTNSMVGFPEPCGVVEKENEPCNYCEALEMDLRRTRNLSASILEDISRFI